MDYRNDPGRDDKRIKILLAKLSVDKHVRGLQTVAQMLRDAGMEIVFVGWCLTPEQVVNTAVQEDADVIALSSHDNFHKALFPKVVRLLREQGIDIPIVAGGIIPEKDKPFLEALGITGNFGPGTTGKTIVAHITEVLQKKRLLFGASATSVTKC